MVPGMDDTAVEISASIHIIASHYECDCGFEHITPDELD